MPQMEIEDAGLDMTDSVEDQEASVATLNTGGTATIVTPSSFEQIADAPLSRLHCYTTKPSVLATERARFRTSGLHLTAGKSTDISASSLLQARRFVSPRQGCLTPRRSEPLSYSLNRTTNVF